jgi:hypothetical protein
VTSTHHRSRPRRAGRPVVRRAKPRPRGRHPSSRCPELRPRATRSRSNRWCRSSRHRTHDHRRRSTRSRNPLVKAFSRLAAGRPARGEWLNGRGGETAQWTAALEAGTTATLPRGGSDADRSRPTLTLPWVVSGRFRPGSGVDRSTRPSLRGSSPAFCPRVWTPVGRRFTGAEGSCSAGYGAGPGGSRRHLAREDRATGGIAYRGGLFRDQQRAVAPSLGRYGEPDLGPFGFRGERPGADALPPETNHI